MSRFADFIALRYDADRTRDAYYRQLRLIQEHFACDPTTLTESQLRDYFLLVKLKKLWQPKTIANGKWQITNLSAPPPNRSRNQIMNWFLDVLYDVSPSISRTSEKRHNGRLNVVLCDGHVEAPRVKVLFDRGNPLSLARWNVDNLPHSEL